MKIWMVGDSNLYGYRPGGRVSPPERWSQQLSAAFPLDDIIINGKNGRKFDTEPFGHRLPDDGRTIIDRDLRDISPDLLVLQLGANDLALSIGVDVLIDGLVEAVDEWRRICPICVILPHADDPTDGESFGPEWLGSACALFARELPDRLPKGTAVIATDDCPTQPYDGVHLTAEGHARLAEKMIRFVDKMKKERT